MACLYASRLKASESLGALLSSKVNQWTLLVGTLPIVFAVSSASFSGLPLDTNQRFELLITAAQSLAAVSLLVTLSLTGAGATVLFALFLIQFLASVWLPADNNRLVILALSAVYGVLALGRLIQRRRHLTVMLRDGLITPLHELSDER